MSALEHKVSKDQAEILNHRAISPTTIAGYTAVAIGFGIFLIGLYIFGIAAGWFPVQPDQIRAPLWVVKVAGIIFAVPGFSIFIYGVRDVWRKRKIKIMQEFHPQHPWRYDYPWSAEGISGRGKVNIFSGLTFVIFVLIFMSPYYWFLQQAKGFAYYFLMMFAFFGALIVFVGVVSTGKAIMQHVKYGRSFFRFQSFPFYLGQTVEGNLECPTGIGSTQEISITLRCIHEQYETRGSGDNKTEKVISYAVYRDEVVIRESLHHSAGSTIPIFFELPKDGVPNDLISRPAKYWELVIEAKTPGVDFEHTYLLPVYQKPHS